MDYKRRYENYYKRWHLAPTPEWSFPAFKNRVLLLLDQVLGRTISGSRIPNRFAYIAGLPAPYSNDSSGIIVAMGTDFKNSQIYKVMESAKSELELVGYLQKLFWVLEEYTPTTKKPSALKEEYIQSVEEFVQGLKETIRITPGINIRVSKQGDQVTIYPAGAKLMDVALVDDNLMWLEDYPGVLNPFEQALVIYQSKDESKYRNLLDNLRVALEQLLRAVLRNRAPLEKQLGVLGRWLEDKAINKEVRNMYITLLDYFTKYQNDRVKHEDLAHPEEIEFMIYLTGTFIRLLLQLNSSVEGEKS